MSSESPPPFAQRMAVLFDPAQIMAMAIPYYIRACTEAVFQRGQVLAPLTQTHRLRDEAFGRFWIAFSAPREDQPPPSAGDEVAATPASSSDLIPPLLSTASGVVLDIGPGTGTQMPLLRSPAISAIYGAEPCVGLHATLRAKAASEGLDAKYHILPCGASAAELVPALQAAGVDQASGVFDTILCVRVLCSVPEMERTARELYALLKPGGRVLVTEHVVNPWQAAKGSLAARVMQGVYMLLGWWFFVGDCCLDRDTEGALRAAADEDGGWESMSLERSFWWSPLPYISGALVKKSA
ncbi:hypothetical protein N7462_003360 [Penicillium macrosclerotiorum]|uniref:uncharacterized protein n=1 Tax=Penicillium macrosclerotiorum TaxID=303699 RepID=UPI002547E82C|nr:uncharacterized protein N7462_003360 [Penicillium macrosclerotiorum]KAJ5688968.1 hypothetical protein N7462_003360 [Penicillium macrosclerotiorum]